MEYLGASVQALDFYPKLAAAQANFGYVLNGEGVTQSESGMSELHQDTVFGGRGVAFSRGTIVLWQ